MNGRRQALGRRGEDEAARYLVERGYVILERNFRRPVGEIDIIARHGGTLVFVEVRARSTDDFGLPQESVDRRKKSRLRRAAACYLADRGGAGGPLRFDVLALKFDARGKLVHLEHIENAF